MKKEEEAHLHTECGKEEMKKDLEALTMRKTDTEVGEVEA